MTDYILVKLAGEYLVRAQAYRAERIKVMAAYSAFAKEVGASGFHAYPGMTPSYFRFQDKIPAGWTAPKKGGSRPHKTNTEVWAKLDALPKFPKTDDVWNNTIPHSIGYDDKVAGISGSSSLTGFNIEHWVGFPLSKTAGEPVAYFGRVPNIVLKATETLAALIEYDKCKAEDITWELDGEPADVFNWKLPAGLTAVSEAEMDLVYAQARVDLQSAKDEELENPH